MTADRANRELTLATEDRRSRGRAQLLRAFWVAAMLLYTLSLYVNPLTDWLGRDTARTLAGARLWLFGVVRAVVPELADKGAGQGLVVAAAFYLLVSFIVPVAVAVVTRRSPGDLGTRWPNRLGWRVLGLAYGVALPVLVWMVRSPTFYTYYAQQLKAGATVFLLSYTVIILTEHFMFQGAVLAAGRLGGRWPVEPPVVAPVDGGGLQRCLRFLGLAQPVGDARGLTAWRLWWGLPAGCGVAMVVSAFLFGAFHVGKDPREALLSWPGGLALAYLAYRTNSWVVPLLLHSATAGTAVLLMLVIGVKP